MRVPAAARGCTLDVLKVVQSLGVERFTLADIYAHENALAEFHPRNRNIRPKVRQQLQVLRDIGLIVFEGSWRYRATAPEGSPAGR